MGKKQQNVAQRIGGVSSFFISRACSPWYPIFTNAVFVFALAFFGAATALVIVEPWTVSAPPVERMQIGRLHVPTGRARPKSLIDLSRARLQSVVTLRAPGFVHRTNWATLGARVDLDTLGHLLVELHRENSLEARYFGGEADEGEIPKIPMPITLDPLAAVESLVALKDVIDRKARNAMFDFETGHVVQEESGALLDVYATLARLDRALAQGLQEVAIDVEQVRAEITGDALGNIDVGTVAGFFETKYSRLAKDRDRTYNVRLGSSMLNGQVIMPGQIFSFNDALGERSEARGFRYAPVIAGGEIVEGMGGGTCQVASTMYAAAFFTGMVVVERRPHSRPSSYIKLGLDATVSYPNIDLKLSNPFSFPVAIHFIMKDGSLRAEFRAKERPYTVTFLRRIIGTKPFPVRDVDNDKLVRGKEVITQNGIPGYTVRRYQLVDQKKAGFRFQTMDQYPPTAQFVHHGTAEPGSIEDDIEDAPKPDTHRPYRASKHLRMVQGAGDLWHQQSH